MTAEKCHIALGFVHFDNMFLIKAKLDLAGYDQIDAPLGAK
jgi:hypothetical protein